MIDQLEAAWQSSHGTSIWSNPDLTFLDPFTKSGVFLREIVKRLLVGLEPAMPDLQKRIDHILTKQVFGIATTTLTSLLARRSVYCSKDATGKHSIATKFKKIEGNIAFEPGQHAWGKGTVPLIKLDDDGNEYTYYADARCSFCGVVRRDFDREDGLELHAYGFIHNNDIQAWIEKTFGEKMQFDVIIGNPPYQLNDGGGEGAGASPIYDQFIEQAKKLNPRYLLMVIPARWYSGGKGLDDFRKSMLKDGKIAEIHDYPETDMVFPGVNIRGGVCYFLWSDSHDGDTRVINYSKVKEPLEAVRPLLESGTDTFIRYNRAVSIHKKVQSRNFEYYSSRVSSRNPFGIPSNFTDFAIEKSSTDSLVLFRSRRGSSENKSVFVAENHVKSGHELIGALKVLVSKASPGGDEYPHLVLSEPIVAPPGSVSTETYLVVDCPKSLDEANNLVAYMSTKFFRFMVSLIKNTQNISKGSFAFTPVMDLSVKWDDETLNEFFGLSTEDIDFISEVVKDVNWKACE